MATNNPRGLVPSRHLNGNISPSHNQYRVSANNPTAMFIGDPVVLFSDGKVRVIATSTPSISEQGVLGVVRSVYDSNGRPLTHKMPAQGQFIDGSTAGYVDVCDDPDTIFLVSTDGTANQSMIGKFVTVTAGAPTSAVGISGIHMKLAEATGSATDHRFMITAVGGNESATGGIGDGAFSNNQDIEVIISNHHWRRQWAVVGTEVGD